MTCHKQKEVHSKDDPNTNTLECASCHTDPSVTFSTGDSDSVNAGIDHDRATLKNSTDDYSGNASPDNVKVGDPPAGFSAVESSISTISVLLPTGKTAKTSAQIPPLLMVFTLYTAGILGIGLTRGWDPRILGIIILLALVLLLSTLVYSIDVQGTATSVYDCAGDGSQCPATLSNLQLSEDTDQLIQADSGGTMRINISLQQSLVPAGATINFIEVCAEATRSNKFGDDAGDSCYVDSGTNYTGTYNYTRVAADSQATCQSWDTAAPDDTVCWDITTFINSQGDPVAAANSTLLVIQSFESADNNANLAIDYIYVNVSYTGGGDITKPTLTNAQVNTTGPTNGTIKLNMSITDDSSVDYALFTVNGTNFSATNVSGTAADDWYYNWACTVSNSYYWNVSYANDTSNNLNSTTAQGLPITFVCDVDAPSLTTRLINETGSVTTGTQVCINATASDAEGNLDTIWAEITDSDGTNSNITLLNPGPCGTSPNTHSINVNVGSSAGTFYFNASWANDTVGNIGGNTTSIPNLQVTGVDTTDPIITIVNPQNQSYTTTTTNYSYFNVTLNEDGNWCGYSLDGAANVSMQNDSTTNWYGNDTGMSESQHNVKYYCNDTAGNMNTTAPTVYFTIDFTAPTFSDEGDDSGGSVSSGTSVDVTALWQDSVGLGSAQLLTNQSGTWGVVETKYLGGNGITTNYSNYTITTSGGDEGNTIIWAIYTNDTAGNLNNTMANSSFAVTEPSLAKDLFRYYVKFDISSVPSGSTINQANLSIYITEAGPSGDVGIVNGTTGDYSSGDSNQTVHDSTLQQNGVRFDPSPSGAYKNVTLTSIVQTAVSAGQSYVALQIRTINETNITAIQHNRQRRSESAKAQYKLHCPCSRKTDTRHTVHKGERSLFSEVDQSRRSKLYNLPSGRRAHLC
jgi:hypothetical protein